MLSGRDCRCSRSGATKCRSANCSLRWTSYGYAMNYLDALASCTWKMHMHGMPDDTLDSPVTTATLPARSTPCSTSSPVETAPNRPGMLSDGSRTGVDTWRLVHQTVRCQMLIGTNDDAMNATPQPAQDRGVRRWRLAAAASDGRVATAHLCQIVRHLRGVLQRRSPDGPNSGGQAVSARSGTRTLTPRNIYS